MSSAWDENPISILKGENELLDNYIPVTRAFFQSSTYSPHSSDKGTICTANSNFIASRCILIRFRTLHGNVMHAKE